MIKNSVQKLWDDMRGHGRLRIRAWRLLHAKKFEPASEMIEFGRKRFAGSISFEILQARYHLLSGNLELANDCIQEIERLSTEDVFDRFELAETYRLMGRYSDAVNLFENLETKGNLNLPILTCTRLASLYYRLEQPEKGLAAVTQCAQLGGYLRQSLLLEIGENCSRELVEKAISKIDTVRLDKPYPEGRRQAVIAFLAATINRWDLAIESVGKATKHHFLANHDAKLWDDDQPPCRPSFLIIGAMKSGTTSLFRQIHSHPQFVLPLNKELHFFFHEKWPDEFYYHQFPRAVAETPTFISGEASPGYYAFDVVDRIKQMLPDIKILFIKRDPVDRAISHLFHNRTNFIEEHPIEALTIGMEGVLELLQLDDKSLGHLLREIHLGERKLNMYLLFGCYKLLMRRWKAAFPPDKLLELDFGDFTAETQKTMDQVFEFIGIESRQVNESYSSNVGSYTDGSDQLTDIRKQLEQFYAEVKESP